MLFKNYGLFWRKEDVFWGERGRARRLYGRRTSKPRDRPVDFALQQGVYVLYDGNFEIVYAGQAGGGVNDRLAKRLACHLTDNLADRWERFSWFGIRKVLVDGDLSREASIRASDIQGVLNHMEALLIAAVEPPNNRQGGRFTNSVEQYLQVRDDEMLGLTDQRIMREVYDGLAAAGQIGT